MCGDITWLGWFNIFGFGLLAYGAHRHVRNARESLRLVGEARRLYDEAEAYHKGVFHGSRSVAASRDDEGR